VKVLFVMSDLGGGGAERVVLTVARYLDRRRFEPSLFLLKNEGVYWDEVSPDMPVQYGASGSGRLRYRALRVFNKLLAETGKNDVVIGTLELLPSYIAYLSGALRRKPVIAWVHADLNRHLQIYGAASIHRRVIRALYPRFRRIVFPSHSARDLFLELAPSTAGKTQVIYNPLDFKMVVSKASENLPDWAEKIFAKPVVVAVGRLIVAIKAFDLLIRAHAELLSRGVDHNLLILGEGSDRQLLERLAEDLGVSKSVSLPGFQQNPYQFIKSACALVVSSRFEAFGMVVLEAMVLGVPVICLTSASGAVEILDSGAYGICVPGEDPSALASAINAVLADPILCGRYSRLGSERVEFFQPEQIVREWEELLWSAAQSSSR
jgi:glycosyltransferase involved in cell wall biosynthesis